MDYYWMMGDNRHNSADSRMWGFVPEDHVVGKASFIWLSLDKDKSLPNKMRLRRMFQFIR
jgi:signal peptidase I